MIQMPWELAPRPITREAVSKCPAGGSAAGRRAQTLPALKSAEAVAPNRLAAIAGFERKVDSEHVGTDAV
jgi:hypothetical protein